MLRNTTSNARMLLASLVTVNQGFFYSSASDKDADVPPSFAEYTHSSLPPKPML